jgi:hypothetical protein
MMAESSGLDSIIYLGTTSITNCPNGIPSNGKVYSKNNVNVNIWHCFL